MKEEQEEAATASPTFVFPEVQEAMKSMNQLDSKGLGHNMNSAHCALLQLLTHNLYSSLSEWMNERFFEKLSRNPKLAQGMFAY